MRLTKTGRKWIVEGTGEGWIFHWKFPTKWKAEVAVKVFGEGGRASDYFKKAREEAPPRRFPRRVTEQLKEALEEIETLDPTCEEIEEFAKGGGHGIVTSARSESYFGPRFHDTWGGKQGGRVHIDIGCCGYHLMLDKSVAEGFVKFIKSRREAKGSNQSQPAKTP
jgi:hypothetical protein